MTYRNLSINRPFYLCNPADYNPMPTMVPVYLPCDFMERLDRDTKWKWVKLDTRYYEGALYTPTYIILAHI